jgi:hypothetical protein
VLSGIIADKVILKNLWYFIFLTILRALYRQQVSCGKITRETSRLSRR